ncbi:MAG: thioredoxin [Hyphomicrobiales bacterium]|nr:thioredoxin [Hyphomicrobiales bacterium]
MYSIFGNDQTRQAAPEGLQTAIEDVHRIEPALESAFAPDEPYRRELSSFDVLILEEESFVPRAPAAPIPVSALAALDRHASQEPAVSHQNRPRAPQGKLREPKSKIDDAAAARQSGRLRRFAPVLSVVGLTVVCSLAIAGRVHIANMLPATAPLYAALGIPANARGLEIRDIRSTLLEDQGQSYLVVEGQIANLRNAPSKLGDLRLSLRDPSGREIYTWSAAPPEARVGAGAVLAFKTRLASPPRDAQDVLVRFGNRG